MRWDAHEIARFARAAGFTGDDVTIATALAIATSGGNASYDVHAGVPGAGHWVGLWGIDTDRMPEWAEVDLHVPALAAEVVRTLHERYRGWSWSPTFRAGAHVPFLAEAGTARTREYDYQRPVTPFTIHDTAKRLRNTSDDLAAMRAKLSTFRPR